MSKEIVSNIGKVKSIDCPRLFTAVGESQRKRDTITFETMPI